MKRNECEILTSESVCRKVFNTQFNVQFHKPKKDTCIKCAGYHMQISAQTENQNTTEQEKLEELKLKKNEHQQCAEIALKELQFDRASAKEIGSNTHVITLDLQSTLPTPRISTNVVHCKRQLMVYNLGIHDCDTEVGHMHVCHEEICISHS